MAENKEIKSKREAFAERMKGKYPDKDFADDEVMFGQISDDYDNYDKQLSEYEEEDKKLSNLLATDPRSASFLIAWKNGEHPMTALVRQFGKDGLVELLENEEKMDEFAKANEEYLERIANEKKLEAEYESNIGESLAVIDSLQQEGGYSEDEVNAALDFLNGIIHDGIVGKYSRESIEMAIKAMNHDTDVSDAAYEGEVRGRNARIEEKLRKPSEGDGTVMLGGRNRQEPLNEKPQSIFDTARGTK